MPQCKTNPRAVLGIDAAWTETQPSGVALVEETAQGWRLVAVETSYARFHALAGGPEAGRPVGSRPVAKNLIETCERLTGRPPDVVAIDMPLSHKSIVERRCSDRAVSRAYGAKKCATHSPSAERPGKISDALREAFAACGYRLQVAANPSEPYLNKPALIEVYPHPALVELTGAAERLRYKISKANKLWPKLKPPERRKNLVEAWTEIGAALEQQIEGVTARLPVVKETASGLDLKAHEDALDAVVCAWVGVCALEGSAEAFGDTSSAIWIPARDRKWPSRRAGSPAPLDDRSAPLPSHRP
jgi:predicted RNase H-like nuclease